MKNIIKVLRHKDEKARLYLLPDGMTVKAGTTVRVEYPDATCTVDGVTISDSYEVDATMERMVAEFHRIFPANLNGLKKVVSVYTENPVVWPVADPDDAEDEDEDADEAENG